MTGRRRLTAPRVLPKAVTGLARLRVELDPLQPGAGLSGVWVCRLLVEVWPASRLLHTLREAVVMALVEEVWPADHRLRILREVAAMVLVEEVWPVGHRLRILLLAVPLGPG